MTIVNPPRAVQAGTYTAQNDRQHTVSAFMHQSLTQPFAVAGRGGLLSYARDATYVINSSPAWSLTIGSFVMLVENDYAANGGDYIVIKNDNDVVTVSPSSPTLNRIDTICVQVVDAFYSGALSEGRLVVVQGTATAGTPSPPTIPPTCEPIVDVNINANSTAPTLGNDRRKRSGLIGAIIPISGIQFADNGTYSGETQYYEALGTYRTWRGGSTNAWRAFGGMLARNGTQLATSFPLATGGEGNSSQVLLNDPGGIWVAQAAMQAEYSWSPGDARVDLVASRNGLSSVNGTLFGTTLPVVSGPYFAVSFAQMAGAQSAVLTGSQTIWFNFLRVFGQPVTVSVTPFNYRASAVQLLVRAS